jgi:carbamoyl-phosphate synthase large subunit
VAVDAVRLLFTGGGGAASEALYRLLSPAHEVCLADATADGCYTIPKATALGFADALAELCRHLKVDLLIPGVDEELLILGMVRDWGKWPCAMLLPDTEFVAVHLDKLKSMRVLEQAGIPVPKTDRIKGFLARYPCVVKPRQGRGSRDVAVVNHAGFLVQDYCEGQEYTVTVVADHCRRLRAIVPAKVVRKQGVTLEAVTEHHEGVTELCQRIHRAMPTAGAYNVQCVDVAGVVLPFEINPRVSTTTCLAIASGVDVIGLSQDASEWYGSMSMFREMRLQRSVQKVWRTEFVA